MSNCGLSAALNDMGFGKGAGGGEGGDGMGDGRAYQTKYPVAWYGRRGWRYYDTSKRGVKHWIPNAPRLEPASMTVYQLHDKALRQRRAAAERADPYASAAREGQDTVDEAGTTSAQDATETFGGKEDPQTTRAGITEREMSSATGSQRRPMGIMSVLFDATVWKVPSKFFARRPVLALFLMWLYMTAYCLALEYAPVRLISSVVSNRGQGVLLGVVQSIPALESLADVIEEAVQLGRRFPGWVLLIFFLPYLPVIVSYILFKNLNRARGALTEVAVALLCAAGVGAIMDAGENGHTMRDAAVRNGDVALYTAVIAFLGGVMLPALGIMTLRSKYPAMALWLFDGLDLPRILRHLAAGASIGVVIAVVMRFNVSQKIREQQASDEADGQREQDDKAVVQRVLAVQNTKRYKFQVGAFGAGLIVVLLSLYLLEFVYPVPFAAEKAVALAHRTSRWR